MFISPKTTKQGFTLIELLVVIVIIGILATMATIAMRGTRANARDAKRISDLKQIANAVELYYADNNSYPNFVTAGNTLASLDGTKVYMKKVPGDPSTSTSYAYYGSTSRFTLRTTIEKSVDNIPIGPVIVTSGGGVRQALNTDNSYMNADLTFGSTLVGHWALDSNTGSRDLTGSNNGSLVVGATVNTVTSTGRFNETDGSYSFDGVDDYVTMGDVLDSVFIGTDAKTTISFWVYHDGSSSNDLISKYSSSSNRQVRVLIRPSYVGFYAYHLGGSDFIYNNSSSGTVPANQWNHVVLVYDNSQALSGKVVWYLNNVKYSPTATMTGTFTQVSDGTAALQIGAMTASSIYTKSIMSDVRIYNRVLLQSEASQLYNATRP